MMMMMMKMRLQHLCLYVCNLNFHLILVNFVLSS